MTKILLVRPVHLRVVSRGRRAFCLAYSKLCYDSLLELIFCSMCLLLSLTPKKISLRYKPLRSCSSALATSNRFASSHELDTQTLRERERRHVEHLLLPKADTQLEMSCEAVALIAGHHVHKAERALVAHAGHGQVSHGALFQGLPVLLGGDTIKFLDNAIKPSHCHHWLRRLRRRRRNFGRHGSLDRNLWAQDRF
jgi:hypothetical protein